jgi:hypothetical protein
MRRQFWGLSIIYWLLGACVAIYLLLGNTVSTQSQVSPANVPGQVDQAKPPVQPQTPQVFPTTETGRLLTEHLNRLADVRPDAEQRYQASLRQLRQQAPKAIPVLFETYQKTKESNYFRRWAIVNTMKELQNDAAVSSLATIALAPIPPERWSDPESSSRSREFIIRVTAVDGLAELAKLGNKKAEAILPRLIKHDNLSIRRRAIRGYLAAGSDYEKRANFLKSQLPTRDHSLITLSVTDIKQVPHPQDVPVGLTAPQKSRDDAPPRIKQ